jgi:hypothetical protein
MPLTLVPSINSIRPEAGRNVGIKELLTAVNDGDDEATLPLIESTNMILGGGPLVMAILPL